MDRVYIMKLLQVTVNYGEYEGMTGIITGYDRNKLYSVKFPCGREECFKPYYLDGIEQLKGNTRFSLPYTDGKFINKKDLMLDKHNYVGKGKGSYSKRFRYFSIGINDDDNKYYTDLSFHETIKKVRYAMQSGYSFFVNICVNSKNSTSYSQLINYSPTNDIIYTTHRGIKDKKYYRTFERGLIKTINSY